MANKEAPKKAPGEEKRKVTMQSTVQLADGTSAVIDAEDFVPMDILDDYVADAKQRWQTVKVGDKHDSGPGGDNGKTHRPKLK